MKAKLAIDMGSTSLGWCLTKLGKDNEPCDITDLGIRIFPDGREDKSKEPLSVSRRGARGESRTRDRRKRRKSGLMELLINSDFMPADKQERKELEKTDPYEYRAKAVREKISMHEIGRALFHINQRRGFKSNRKTDGKENDLSNMKIAIRDLEAELGSKTLGEYLYDRNANIAERNKKGQPLESRKQSVRVKVSSEKNKNVYNLYPSRKMYEEEVDKIFDFQRPFHPELTDEICEEIKETIFFQRPLKPIKPGFCRFENKERRARKAYTAVQKFRVLQETNNLRLVKYDENEPDLTDEQRRKVADALMREKKKTFGQIRTLLGISRNGPKFNLESENRKELFGDDTSAILADDKGFGENWFSISEEKQNELVDLLFDTDDRDKLIAELLEKWELPSENAAYVADAPLQEGHGALSLKAIHKILPYLEKGMLYSDAVRETGYHHSDFRTGEVLKELPYYGELLPDSVIGGTNAEEDKNFPEKFWGKINNPTVHIALNQLRKLVNEIIEYYGMPDEIAVELARDLKQNPKDINKEQGKNKKDNDRINDELEKLGVKQNYANRMQYKLWEDLAKDSLKRCCPFSGRQIAEHQIFSGEFEIEHLLPFSRSYNDGRANKVLSHRDANREKGNRSPYEAFGHTPEWNDIIARAENLPGNKLWRFQPDAWDKAKGEGEDIIARQLNDTRYMTRVAAKYLSFLYPEKGKGSNHITTIPGQLTAMFRDKWGLNNLFDDAPSAKDRTDHRHHAIDAFVVSCTTRGMLQRVASEAKKVEEKKELWGKRKKLAEEMPKPFDGYREKMRELIENVVISYKPDHGGAARAINAKRPYTIAPLHKQTAYGLVGSGKKKGHNIYVSRVSLASLEKIKNVNEVADDKIRERLLDALKGIKENSAEWKQALDEFSEKHNIKHVRTHIEKKPDTMIGIWREGEKGKPDTKPYKYYELRGNYCAEIYCPDKGKKAGKWQCEIISNYHAHQKDFIQEWRREHPTAKLIMRLQINDMVAYEEEGKTVFKRVRKLNRPNKPVFVDLNRAKLENNEGWPASSEQLQQKNARKISVDILGHVKDPLNYRKGKNKVA